MTCEYQRGQEDNKAHFAETYAMENITESVAMGLEGGVSREEMVDRLVDAGAEPEAAAAFVVTVDAERRKAHKRNARGSVLFGLVLVAVGIGITVITYSMAGPGGTYVVTWGVSCGGCGSLAPACSPW